MRVLFLIPVKVSKSYEYRVLAQCDAGIIFNTCERRANVCGHRSRYHVGINFNTCVVRECALYILVCSPIDAGIFFNTRMVGGRCFIGVSSNVAWVLFLIPT